MIKTKRFLVSLLSAEVLASLFAAPAKPDLPRWKNNDERHYISGKECSSAFLSSHVVLVMGFNLENFKDMPFGFLAEAMSYRKEKRFVCVCSLKTGKLNKEKLEKLLTKNKMTIDKELAIYNDIGLSQNEPEMLAFPAFYVVDHKGNLAYQGDGISDAMNAVDACLAKLPAEDSILGIDRPEKIMEITNYLHEGASLRPAYDCLKKHFRDKDPDAIKEAKRLIESMDGKFDMRMKELVLNSTLLIGQTAWDLLTMEKMWGQKTKADERYAQIIKNRKDYEDGEKIAKIVVQCEQLSRTEIKKKQEAKKIAAVLDQNLKKLQRLEKSKTLIVKDEAMQYSQNVKKMLETVKNWMPPAPSTPPAQGNIKQDTPKQEASEQKTQTK